MTCRTPSIPARGSTGSGGMQPFAPNPEVRERSCAPSPRAGFTLIEVLVTLVILATGIVLVLRAFETSLVALGAARDTLRGALLIQEKMADVQWAALTDGAGGPSSSSEKFDTGLYRGFRRDCRVTRADDGAGSEHGALYRVEVSVESDAGLKELAAVTYVNVMQAEKK